MSNDYEHKEYDLTTTDADRITCTFEGCNDANALNHEKEANKDDGSCRFA